MKPITANHTQERLAVSGRCIRRTPYLLSLSRQLLGHDIDIAIVQPKASENVIHLVMTTGCSKSTRLGQRNGTLFRY
jgi:hypothetical protein